MSRTLSTNSGSVDSLKVSTRCGCSPKARQMRPTLEVEMPLCRAMLRVLQCVAAGGRLSSVCTMTFSTLASSIVRGARNMAHTRAADDFQAIRARMEEFATDSPQERAG